MANLVLYLKRYERRLRTTRIRREMGPLRPAVQGHSRSLEPTRIDHDDFLLVIRSNHGPINNDNGRR